VSALAVSGMVYAGGSFTSIGGKPQSYLAAISPDQTVAVNGDPSFGKGSLTVTPNPTRAHTHVGYAVHHAGHVRLELLDASGRVVETLVDRDHVPGHYGASWGAARRHRSGLYFVRLLAPHQTAMRKLVLIR